MKYTIVLVGILLLLSLIVSPIVTGGQLEGSTPKSGASNQSNPNISDNDSANHSNSHLKKTSYPNIIDGLLIKSEESPLTTETVSEVQRSVVIEFSTPPNSTLLSMVDSKGSITSRHGQLVEAKLPLSAIRGFSKLSSVRIIRQPQYLESSAWMNKGLEKVNATGGHDQRYTGDNITVAIIDTGFNLENQEIANNVIQSRDFSDRGINNSSAHGTATAEIVANVAPNSSLVLASVETGVQLLNATNWVSNNTSAEVVSISMGFAGGTRLDGSSRFDKAISKSTDQGLAWIVSAGNEANGNHWNGTWRDVDEDKIMEFDSAGDETMEVTAPLELSLQWRDWPNASNDYDIFLLNQSSTDLEDLNTSVIQEHTVQKSTNIQNGSQPPVEKLKYDKRGDYELVIYQYNASGSADFDLFMETSGTPEYWTTTRSITPPATGSDVVAVGAIDVETEEVEPFSSRGPTVDGRLKPDLVAPDRITTSTYESYAGTSAAAPHVAGAGALMLEANSSLTPGSITSTLQKTAAPRAWSTPNFEVGSGLVDINAAVRSVRPTLEVFTNVSGAINAGEASTIEVTVTESGTQEVVQAANVSISGEGMEPVSNKTGEDGTVMFSINPKKTGNLTVNATKLGTNRGKTIVNVQKSEALLNLSVNEYPIAPGETVLFSLTNNENDPIEGVVTVNETNFITSDGRVNVTFSQTGGYTAVAHRNDTNTTRYENDSVNISVAPDPAFEVSFDIHPRNGTVEEPVTVTALVENTGDISNSTTIRFYRDGTEFANKTLEIPGGESSRVNVTTRFSQAGVYNVTVNDLPAINISVEKNATDGLDVIGNGTNAQDLDGDQLYEDVNGNDYFNIVDVNALFQNYNGQTVQNNIDKFDFNADGSVNIVDVNQLFQSV